MATISNVPIFKVGIHNGKEFLMSDLDQLVTNFNRLKSENSDFQVPVKIGHDKDNDSEKPAIGWADNLRIEGGFLKADFVDVNDSVYEMIKDKALKNRSIELFRNFKDSTGAMIGKTLKGIALLGGSLPAVNLPDIRFHSISEAVLAFQKDNEADTYHVDDEVSEFKDESNLSINNEEEEVMGAEIKEEVKAEAIEPVKEDLKSDPQYETFAKFKDMFKDYATVDEFMASLKAKEEVYEAKLKEISDKEAESFAAEQKSFIDGLIKSDQLLPAERPYVEAVLFSIGRDEEIEFSASEFKTKEKKALLDVFKSFLTVLPKRGNLVQEGSQNVASNWGEMFSAYVKERKQKLPKELTAEEYRLMVAECRKTGPHAENLYLSTQSKQEG